MRWEAEVDAVVFDLDGTLFDHVGSAQDAVTAWLRGLGIAPTSELVTAWFAAEERHIASWRAGECSWAEQRRRRVRDILPLVGQPVGDDAQLDAAFAGYLRAYEAAWRPFDDAQECVNRLAGQGYRLAMLTNGAEEQQREKLAAIGLADAFEAVLTAEALGVGKPDPRAYQAVCTALDLPGERCLFIGDDHALDVVAPRAVGLHAVHLDRSGAPGVDDERITTLTELPGLLGERR